MIEYVKNGVVMANGRDDLKELADFITHATDDNGIEHALKHFKLI